MAFGHSLDEKCLCTFASAKATFIEPEQCTVGEESYSDPELLLRQFRPNEIIHVFTHVIVIIISQDKGVCTKD